jgi:hypothetical protein
VWIAVFSTMLASAQAKPEVLLPLADKPSAETPRSAPKPYKDIITKKAITSRGFITVHKVEEKYFLEIAPHVFGRDILIVNRVSKSSVQSPKTFGGYAGDQIGENVIRFEKGPNNKIFLKNILTM